jgi:RNA polymerase sigma-70 factor (ECF subfamily)
MEIATWASSTNRPRSSAGNAPTTSWDDVDDAALAAAIAGGEAEALEQLYRRYRAIAFATAYALLQDAAAAEDVTQDAFLRAWRGASIFQANRGSLRSWLLAIVRHRAVDALRARQIDARAQPRLMRIADAPSHDDPPELFAAMSDAARLRLALDHLPCEQRDVIELAFLSGLTHGEIAARIGAPLGTVKGRVRLGLRRLRRELADLREDRLPAPAAAG